MREVRDVRGGAAVRAGARIAREGRGRRRRALLSRTASGPSERDRGPRGRQERRQSMAATRHRSTARRFVRSAWCVMGTIVGTDSGTCHRPFA
ncbi:hypothetical protein STTU_2993 [Streptomyces sp. Tu6071]|nr:hypothetical protein STTU_2993 [Streptomyces sp. Tu6071]